MRPGFAIALVLTGVLVGLTGNPLSGTTVLAFVLGMAGLWVLIPWIVPPDDTITVDEACDLIEREHRR